MTKEECEQEAMLNKRLAIEAARLGEKQIADRADARAREWQKQADSWLYRWFGW